MKKFMEFFAKNIAARIAAIAVLVAVVAFIGFKIGTNGAQIESTTTKLTFENIGELATQSAYCTQVTVTDKDQKFFNISVPFTQTKYIYSYNVNVKAGYNFEEITYDVDDEAKEIKVYLPDAQILSAEVDTDSFKVYHEQDSMFTKISLDETNQALSKMQETAKTTAIENGIYDEAETNAKSILTGFFASAYDMNTYTLTLEHK